MWKDGPHYKKSCTRESGDQVTNLDTDSDSEYQVIDLDVESDSDLNGIVTAKSTKAGYLVAVTIG